jgi:hypothetical protein
MARTAIQEGVVVMIRWNARVFGGATLIGSLAIAGALLLSAPAEAADGCYSGSRLYSEGKCLDGQVCKRGIRATGEAFYYWENNDGCTTNNTGGIRR